MGVALSQAGWDRFARHGLTQADLCWKDLVIYGPNGKKHTAQLMDTCPYDEATQTCGSGTSPYPLMRVASFAFAAANALDSVRPGLDDGPFC